MEETKVEKMDWIKAKPSDVEKIIVDLHKQGNNPDKIGLILRDMHGIPKSKLVTKKRIIQILRENKININPDKDSINNKVETLKVHIEKNKKDQSAKRSLTKKLWIAQKLN